VIALLDVDGTLVDTNYHHAVAWYRAFRRFDVTLPLADLHRHMGMGGDQLVGDVAGEDFDRKHGEDVRAAEKEEYGKLIDEVAVLEGADELIAALRDQGATVILASSAKEEEIKHYLSLLGTDDLPYTTSSDVEATKPEPDLVLAALEKAGHDGNEEALMLGDSTYDCEAAKRAGVRTIGLLTGGFSEQELLEAGAHSVHSTLADAIESIRGVVESAAPAQRDA
jgi:HAD superfamily hydrolase (TIGR01549 family)